MGSRRRRTAGTGGAARARAGAESAMGQHPRFDGALALKVGLAQQVLGSEQAVGRRGAHVGKRREVFGKRRGATLHTYDRDPGYTGKYDPAAAAVWAVYTLSCVPGSVWKRFSVLSVLMWPMARR